MTTTANTFRTQARSPYDRRFFQSIEQSSRSSAEVIVPLVRELIPFRTVVDVGCGCGVWLEVFQQYGAEEIAGYDGDYVDVTQLLIPRDAFHAADLSKPVSIRGSFDLAICLEVAEHLPRSVARPLVSALCRSSHAVLFSAAIPGQCGTNHINEQWSNYWEVIFATEDYVRLDPIRPRVFREPNVAPWYKQNTFLYVKSSLIDADERLADELRLTRICDVDIVSKARLVPLMSVQGVLGELRRAIARSVKKRLGF